MRLIILFFALCIVHAGYCQIPPNGYSIVYLGGPDLVLNALPESGCAGICEEGGRNCISYYYTSTAPVSGNRLTCNFTGDIVINEHSFSQWWVDYADDTQTGCQLVNENDLVTGTFTVTGVDYNWKANPGPICPGNTAPVNLNNYITVTSGTTFSGPGVTGTTFNPATTGPGLFTITASKSFSNGTATKTLSIQVVESGAINTTAYSICPNEAVSIAVTPGTGSVASYQWQESSNGGSSWTNLSNTGIYAGTTSSNLFMSSFPASKSGYQYRALINYTCGQIIAKNKATVTVRNAPTITASPMAATVCEGSAASFSVQASGNSTLSYRWQKSLTGGVGTYEDIVGATSTTYSIPSASLAAGGYYRVIVNGGCASAEAASVGVLLTVNAKTIISTHPAAIAVCPGSNASMTVTASGSGTLSYQWMISTNGGTSYSNLTNTGVHSGVTTKTLSIMGATTSLNGVRYQVVTAGGCGSVNSNPASLTVNATPATPTVASPSRCGDGSISATASSSASSPVFNWYSNQADASPVYTGPTYTISNLTTSTTYYVSVTSQTCVSNKAAVIFNYHPLQNVPLGDPLALCSGQGIYNLENDITASVAKGSNFIWTANGVTYASKNFDPSIGAGTYTVSYDPPAAAKTTPYCYIQTSRNIGVTSNGGDGGISFTGSEVSNSTVNACVGDNPIDISVLPSIPGGTWTTVNGTGLSFSGNGVVFTPDQSSYTSVTPNVFRYTVQVNGCSASKDLNIYVKDNQNPPIITGIPSIVCPGKVLSLAASVSVPGTYAYEWYLPGETAPFATGNNLSYTVDGTGTLEVRSINSPFGCRSEGTLAQIVTPFSSGIISVDRQVINAGEMIQFSTDALASGNSFAWDFGDGGESFEQSPAHFYYAPGQYEAKLNINSNLGCSQTIFYYNIVVNGVPIDIVTHADDIIGETVIKVFPNPIVRILKVSSPTTIEFLRILDTSGRVLVEERPALNDYQLDVSDLPGGIYILSVAAGRENRVVKFLKVDTR